MSSPGHTSYADVVLPVPLHQAFTYTVPGGMAVAAGVRVWAPWGSRKLIGVVTALQTEPPPGVKASQIKPLAGVVDAAPLLDAAMLELVRWAAAYYQAPVGELMRAALPPGPARSGIHGDGGAPAPRMQRFYRLAPPRDGARLTPAQRQLITVLEEAGGEADAAWLRPRVSASALQTLLRHGRLTVEERAAPPPMPAWQPRARVATLNSSQSLAMTAIDGADGKPVLLHGVTGSGKTAVYIAAITAALARGEAALMLVPEIGLTPALFADFEDAFPGLVAVLHSGLSNAERTAFWHRLHQGAARVAIGTRSAVFAPLPRLGLIVVDEEHDASYKQQESPRYHGRDLAILRARLTGARIVLGSATPSLESATHARSGKYRLAEMRDRVQHRPLPTVRLVDMSAEFRRHTAAASGPAETQRAAAPAAGPRPELIYSEDLRAAIADRLARRQQAIVLINRRGFAPVVLCRSCGSTVMCRDCSLSLTFHRRANQLVCHYCGYRIEAPRTCPGCGSEHLYFLGSGSEKAETTLQELFPEARIARLDRDTASTRRHFERVLSAFRAGEYDLLIGTQMIAKGHDLPGVTLVGVLQADLGLNFPDYRAAERTFQLLTQVAGRAGRGEHPGEVIVQVQHPEHYAVTAASQGDYAGFFDKEAQFRRWMHYPPFAALALVQLRHANYDHVLALTTQAGEHLRAQLATNPGTRLLGPSPALVARAKTEYRFQFLFKSSSRRELGGLLAALRTFAREHRFPATALVIDVDPLNL